MMDLAENNFKASNQDMLKNNYILKIKENLIENIDIQIEIIFLEEWKGKSSIEKQSRRKWNFH